MCNLVIKFCIYGLVFLMPLFWLPWTTEVYEFNKQYLLVYLVVLALLAWLTKMIVVQKKVVFKRTPLDVWILVFMLIMILSASFSIDKVSSWLGFYGRFSDSVVSILALGLMYFVVVNNVVLKKAKAVKPKPKPEEEELAGGLMPDDYKLTGAAEMARSRWGLPIKNIFKVFLTSILLVVIISYLSVFGLWAKISGLPQLMSLRSFNPVNGSLEGLSIFLVAVIGFLIGLIFAGVFSRGRNKKGESNWPIKGLTLEKIVCSLVLAGSVILLIIINFRAAWLALGITMLVLLVIAFWTRMFRQRVNLLILPIILLLIASIYWFGLPAKAGVFSGLLSPNLPLPQELILDQQTGSLVTWQTLKDYPVFGSGPGTFLAGFAKFKPAEFNQTNFWNIRFDKAPSQLLEILGTTGILGILSYLLIAGIFLLIMFLALRRMGKQTSLEGLTPNPQFLPLFLPWLALLVGQFVYLGNTALSFYFWFFIALGIISWRGIQAIPFREITFSFKKLPEVGLVMNVILIIVIFALVGLFYLSGQFYLAEVKGHQPVADNRELITKLEEMVNLNGYRENYRRALSQAYLVEAWTEAAKPTEEQNVQLLQALVSASIGQANVATTLSPNGVTAWENSGVIYRDLRGLVGGTLPLALESFGKAIALEPTNPLFYRQLCRLNLISEEKDWNETVSYCQKAIDLKPNYLDAHIQLALVYEQKGELEEAVKQMESILNNLKGVSFQRGSDLAGAATEIYFQLGRLHFNLNHVDQAIAYFEQAVYITPYANAHYALGLAYQAKGRLEDALSQFKIVNQLVPDDENVKATIEALEQQLTPALQ